MKCKLLHQVTIIITLTCATTSGLLSNNQPGLPIEKQNERIIKILNVANEAELSAYYRTCITELEAIFTSFTDNKNKFARQVHLTKLLAALVVYKEKILVPLKTKVENADKTQQKALHDTYVLLNKIYIDL